MIYECMDCKHCADFADGFRIYCLHPELPPDDVLKYEPLGDKDAENCSGFEEGIPQWFPWKFIAEYEKYSMEKYGDVTYEGAREWCEQTLR